MKSVAIFFVLLSGALGGDIYRVPFTLRRLTNETLTSENSKIYGGKIAPEGKFPYMVLVLIQDRDGDIFRCSASLVTPNWVMLAAHCVNSEGLGPENLILAGGKAKIGQYMQARLLTPFEEDIEDDVFGVQERRAAEFVKHPKFDSENFHHDIALIRLKTNFNETIKTLNISSGK